MDLITALITLVGLGVLCAAAAFGIAVWLIVVLPLLALASVLVNAFVRHKDPLATKGGCPQCGGTLHPIRSQFIKMCGSCDYQEPWELKPGQKPLIGSNRGTRK